MKKSLLISVLSIFSVLNSFAQDYIPKSNGEVVKHSYYSLSYTEEHEQAEWVYYKLTRELTRGSVTRTNDFRPDPKVSSGSAQLADYKGSGYDRGHLCPAGSMDLNIISMSESFYLSNMSPQNPSFNRGIWKSLEENVRDWTFREGALHVVTGPIFMDKKGSIGPNAVSVPGYYYKVIFDPTGQQKMLGFVLPNEKGIHPLQNYIVTVDSIENITGIDFFPQLPNKIEEEMESHISASNWNFSTSSSSISTTKKSSSSTSSASQCNGIAKSTGVQCKNKTTNVNGYCHVHQSQAPGYVKPKSSSYSGRCNATTKAGSRCKRKAASGSRYCWQHQ